MTQGPQYRIYWQPGCSSCLKAKEFLARRGIPYTSINVHAQPDGLAELRALGARSVPVVARGDEFVAAQDIDELARFLGVAQQREKLSTEALAVKLELIMAATDRYLAQLPDAVAQHRLRKDRTVLDLAFHVFVIVTGFLDAARGGALTEDYFYRTAAPGMTAADVRSFGDRVRRDFADWWRQAAQGTAPDSVATYYGTQALPAFFERTCWHAAQHCRQLMLVLQKHDIAPDSPLGDAELAGLPLPEQIWDDQVAL
jgi:glutaredoxin